MQSSWANLTSKPTTPLQKCQKFSGGAPPPTFGGAPPKCVKIKNKMFCYPWQPKYLYKHRQTLSKATHEEGISRNVGSAST